MKHILILGLFFPLQNCFLNDKDDDTIKNVPQSGIYYPDPAYTQVNDLGGCDYSLIELTDAYFIFIEPGTGAGEIPWKDTLEYKIEDGVLFLKGATLDLLGENTTEFTEVAQFYNFTNSSFQYTAEEACNSQVVTYTITN